MARRLGWIAGVCVVLVISQATGQLTGWLSNFDAHNYLRTPVDNLELDFFGEIDTTDILKWYKGPNGWGNPPRIRVFPSGTFPGLPAGMEVSWIDRINPIKHCETRHFGLRLDPTLNRLGVQAYWTRIVKVEQIPVPWQFWVIPEFGLIVDIIRLSQTFPQPVYIRRWFALLDNPVPLNNLNWQLDAPWHLYDQGAVQIVPGDSVELYIEYPPGTGAVLVRYEVSLEDAMEPIITRFTNEAVLGGDSRQIIGVLSNFDAHNFLDEPVDNLELDFFGEIDTTDILKWYKGPNSWGNPPRIRGFPPGTFPDLPGGVEVSWIDRINPIKHCETRHFGLEIDPSVPPPGVQAYWTRIEKVEQIPVPWQFWRVFDDCRVQDIIFLSETYTGSVIINREYALLSEAIPLDSLNWGLEADWQSVKDDPSTLRPGDSLVLEIQTSEDEKAVLVRYTVAPADSPELIVTRFVNEAIKEPCAPEEDLDFGDAPDPPYPSLRMSNGARHLNPPAPNHRHYEWLGDKDTFAVYQGCDSQNPQVDEESDSWQVDKDSPTDYPGPDDGVRFHLPYTYCKEETVDVLVSTSGAGASRYGQGRLLYLNAWFDWNSDGDWNDPTEHIVWKSATVIGPSGAGTAEPIDGTSTYKMDPSTWSTTCRLYRLTFHCDAKTDTISWARFRLSYNHNANTPTGFTEWGEVEDWKYPQKREEGIEERGVIPSIFKLSKNIPDPFTTITSIQYTLPRKARVMLSVYNALGEKVKILVDSEKQAGIYTVDWKGKDDKGERVPAGVYFYRLETGEYSQTIKMVLLR